MLLWLFISLVQAHNVERLQFDEIEYLCGEGSLNLLLSQNRQFTFDRHERATKVATVLQKALFQGECHFQQDGIHLSPDAVVCDVLRPSSSLVCSNQKFHFVEFQAPIQPEHHEKLLQYQQQKKLMKATAPPPQRDYPFNSADIIADTFGGSILGYFWHFMKYHFGPLHPFNTYTGSDTGIYSMQTGEQKLKGKPLVHKPNDDQIRIAMTADFGAGTREAAYVSELMVKDFNPHFTLHGGDVYFVGDPGEMASNALGIPPPNTKYGVKFPIGSMGAFAMNGNHEMYSRGYGYYDELLPTLGIINQTTGKPSGQKASYSALENAYWRLIDLDTGYNTYKEYGIENNNNTQPKPVIDWLQDEINLGDPTDRRGIILFSHHQYFSAFGKEPPSIATPAQIAALLPKNRTILWLWGHEHRLSFYDLNFNQSGLPMSVYGRCVGNGGFPSTVAEQPQRSRETRLKAYDDRLYHIDIGFKKVPVGYNGWLLMTFQANNVTIEYRSLMFNATGNLSNTQSALLVVEKFTVDTYGSVGLTNFTVVDKNLTMVTHS